MKNKQNAAAAVDDALSWLVAEVKAQEIEPDEFTIEMAIERIEREGGNVTKGSMESTLSRMLAEKMVTKRLVKVDGKRVLAWKRVA